MNNKTKILRISTELHSELRKMQDYNPRLSLVKVSRLAAKRLRQLDNINKL